MGSNPTLSASSFSPQKGAKYAKNSITITSTSTSTIINDARGKTAIAVGVDGGAGQLKWAVRRGGGAVQYGQAPGANLQLLGWEEYSRRLMEAVQDALRQVAGDAGGLRSLGLGLSGVDRPSEKTHLRDWMVQNFPAVSRWWIGNDAVPALRLGAEQLGTGHLGAGRLEGIVIIAGTGSFCLGMTAGGERVRVGGWGGTIGDEGSGYWIGRRALNWATQMADGRRESTGLPQAILDAFGLNEMAELIPFIARHEPGALKQVIASLTPRIVVLAQEGDLACAQLIEQAVAHLGTHVFAAARGLDEIEGGRSKAEAKAEPVPLRPRTVVCTGGLFEQTEAIFERLKTHLAHGGTFTVVRLSEPAALGALLLGEEYREPA